MDTPTTPTVETITVQGQAPTAKSHLWAGDHFSFHDLLDAINPLQHIPIVGTIYRDLTGDTLGNAARVVGDGIYGGVIGVIAGLVDVSVLESTGKDIGGNIIAALGGDKGDKTAPPADQPASPPASAAPTPTTTPTTTTTTTTTTAPTPAPDRKPEPAAAPPAVAGQAASPAPVPAAPSGIPLAPAAPKLMALNSPAHGFPIDTSPEGILALRTTANSAPKPMPLNIPAGTLAPNRRIPLTGAEFVQRMQEGLDKYKAMVVARDAASAGTSVDQVQ